MRFVSISHAKDHLPELIRLASKEAVILTRSGHPCAKIERMDADDLEEEALYRNPKFLRWLESAYKSSFRGPTLNAQSYLQKLRSQYRS